MLFAARLLARLDSLRLRSSLLLTLIAGMLMLASADAQVNFTGASTFVSGGYNQPTGVAVDGSGNVYVIVFGGNQQLKETLQADGTYIESQLPLPTGGFAFPWGVAVDSSGNIFIPNSLHNSVVQLTPSGGSYNASTLSLNAGVYPTGVAVDAAGNLYVASLVNSVYMETPTGGGNYTQSTIASGLGNGGPYGVAVDSLGNVYIADTGDNQVLMETPAGGGTWTQTTIGSGLSRPAGVAVDAQGNVYISDSGNNRILKEILSAGSYTQSTIGGGFTNPQQLTLDGNGNLYVANDGGGTVLELHIASVPFRSVAVGSSSTLALNFTVASGTTVGSVGILTTGAASVDFTDAGSGTCTAETYSNDTTCVVNVSFAPVATGLRRGAVVLYDSSGNALASVPVYGTGTGPQVAYGPGIQSSVGSGYNVPFAVAVDDAGNTYVGDDGDGAVYKITPGGTQTNVGSGFGRPRAVAVDGVGNVFISDVNTQTISEITPAGVQTQVATGISSQGMSLDGAGNLYVASYNPPAVYKLTPGGTQTTVGSGYHQPYDVAVDAAGNAYVVDAGGFPPGSANLYEITPNGTRTLLATGFRQPWGVAVDAAGNVYVTDKGAGSLIEVSPTGAKTTLNSSPDPIGVALDRAGNILVVDAENANVTRIDRGDVPSLSFATTIVGSTSSDSPRTVQIENVGNQPLNITALTYPTDFPQGTGDSSDCTNSTTLDAGQQCDLPIDFTPQSAAFLSENVTLTDNALNVSGATQSVGVSGTGQAPAPTHFSVSGPSPVTASSGFTITVTALDASNNLASGYSGTVHFTSTDLNAVLPGNMALSGGTGTFSVILASLGMQSITATDTLNSSLTGAGVFSVNPGPAMSFMVSAPASTIAGAPINLTVTAYDAYGNVASGYAGTVQFTSTDTLATLPAPTTLTNGTGTFSATLATAGMQTITAADSVTLTVTGVSNAISVTIPNIVVTTTSDATYSDTNCTPQTTPGTGTDAACGLRDALQYALTNGSASITFDSTVFSAGNSAAQNTITLANGTMSIPANVTILGPSTGTGAALKYLVTVDAAGGSSVFYVTGSTSNTTISGLNITGGAGNYGAGVSNDGAVVISNSVISANSASTNDGSNSCGGAIISSGTLELINSTVTGNSSTSSNGGGGFGGGICNNGTMVIGDSTIANNTAGSADSVAFGGGIYNAGTLTLINATLSGNSSTAAGQGQGGGIYTRGSLMAINDTISANTSDDGGGIYLRYGPAMLGNNIISGNTASLDQDFVNIEGTLTDNGGNQTGVSGIGLAPLANYGGSMQTMLPLPGSPAICGGSIAADVGLSADQRGYPRTTTYSASSCVDSGADQTNYTLSFGAEPPPTVYINQAIAPAPVVQLNENGAVAAAASGTIALTDSSSLLTGTTSASITSGLAAFNNLLISSTTSGDTLTATLALNASLNITANSTSFAATKQTPSITWNAPLPIVYGTALSATQLNASASVPGAFNYSPAAGTVLNAGLQTLSVTFTPTDTVNYTAAISSVQIAVSQATPTITWANPAPINYGTALSSTQLNASASVSGTFAYTPAAGAVLGAGPRTLSVLFTPSDTTDYTTAAATASIMVDQPASITAPVSGTTLSSGNVTFTWTAGSGATQYELWLGTVGINTRNIYNSPAITGTSLSVAVPANGVNLYARLWSLINGAWQPSDAVYMEAGTPTQAVLTTPTPSSALPGSNVTFSWTPGSGPTAYELWLGTTGVGSSNLYNSGSVTSTSVTATGLPTYSVAVYARLYSRINGQWQATDYRYTEAAPVLAALTSPAPNTQLSGSGVTFGWSAGRGVTQYQLWLGTTGVGSSNVYNSGALTTTSASVTGLPTNGVNLYARLSSLVNGAWQYADYVYTQAGTAAPATMTLPAPSTQLTGSNVTFSWTTGTGATQYQLLLGTTGVGSSDLYYSGQLTTTSATATGLPVKGLKVFARLLSMINGQWQSIDYTYTEFGAASPAALITPAQGSQLTGANATFTWSPGTGPTRYELWLGSKGVNTYDLYNSGATTATSVNVTGLPMFGVTIYVRLWSLINGAWQPVDYTITESGSPSPAALITPASGTKLGPSVSFTWTTGAGPTQYELWLGSTHPGSSDLYNSGALTTTSVAVTGLPQNNEIVYARLWSRINGNWQAVDYSFAAQ